MKGFDLTQLSPSSVKSVRLTKPTDYEALLKNGWRFGSRSFLARALNNAGQGPRLGLIVGKKMAPRSVDRNRVKRLVRIVHRHFAADFQQLDLVVQLRSGPRDRDNLTLFKELHGLMLGVLNQSVNRA